jgi:methionyl-tRNA formyltransferase
MRIVLIGAVKFSESAFERLVAIDANVTGVVTLETSSFNADYRDLRPVAEAHAIPFVYAPNVNSDSTRAWIANKKPEVIFCFGWSRLLKKELLQMAPLGVVGFHPTALPANRGRHPLIWALALGLQETASTFFFMDEGADDGDILSQAVIQITPSDDAASLYARVTESALEQIETFVPQLSSGSFPRSPQDHEKSNTWRKRGKADGQIDWRMSSTTIHNLVRALTKPYVGAHFVLGDEEVKVWKTDIVPDIAQNVEPGRVADVDRAGPIVKCGEHAIRLTHTEPVLDLSPGEYL